VTAVYVHCTTTGRVCARFFVVLRFLTVLFPLSFSLDFFLGFCFSASDFFCLLREISSYLSYTIVAPTHERTLPGTR